MIQNYPNRRGFTLVEMLVVLAILVLVMALVLPAIQSVRESANQMKCQNHLKQLGLALHTYHSDYGTFPTGQYLPILPNMAQNYTTSYDCPDPTFCPDRLGTIYRGGSWFQPILPYVSQSNVNKNLLDWMEANNVPGAQPYMKDYPNRDMIINSFICPSEVTRNKNLTWTQNPTGALPRTSATSLGFHSNYALCHGRFGFNPDNTSSLATPQNRGMNLDGCFFVHSQIRLTDILDGHSTTIISGEILLKHDSNRDDTRGRVWDSNYGNGLFSTREPPNSTAPDRPESCNTLYAGDSSDLAYCDDVPLVNYGTPAWSVPQPYQIIQNVRSYHPRGCNVGFADGSVRRMANDVNPGVFAAMGSRNFGEPIDETLGIASSGTATAPPSGPGPATGRIFPNGRPWNSPLGPSDYNYPITLTGAGFSGTTAVYMTRGGTPRDWYSLSFSVLNDTTMIVTIPHPGNAIGGTGTRGLYVSNALSPVVSPNPGGENPPGPYFANFLGNIVFNGPYNPPP